METKNRSGAIGRFEVDGAVVPLQNLVGLGQSDAAAVFFCGEIELEDFVAQILRNAATLVANLGNDGVVFALGGDREDAER